jgi:hypothetical protein
MKGFITVAIFCTVLNLIYAQRASNFGSGDISQLLRNNALIQQEINCVLDRGPCDELGRMLKCKFITKLLVCLFNYICFFSVIGYVGLTA